MNAVRQGILTDVNLAISRLAADYGFCGVVSRLWSYSKIGDLCVKDVVAEKE